MIDFETLYGNLTNDIAGNQKRLPIQSGIGVFFGLSSDGNPRISFMSANSAPKIESTKMIKVSQGRESNAVYWTCFDLVQLDAKKVFFSFCANLIESVEGVMNEKAALSALKHRYVLWKSMFKSNSSPKISREVLQGLFGELYFLSEYLMPTFGIRESVKAWGGPDANSKDFSINNEWYEIKTVSVNAVQIHISSLAQLSSKYSGKLVIVRVEAMAESFSNGKASIMDLFNSIINRIEDEDIESYFLMKFSSYGIDLSDCVLMSAFDVKEVNQYKVDDSFPRLTEANILRPEICGVEYSLTINSLLPYKEK